jgi:SAM-dependent methyltransferase
MEINERYTAVDHEYRDGDVYALAKYRWTVRQVKRLGIKSSARVANIGCGAGTFTQMLAAAGYSVVGAEPDPEAFLVASTRVPTGCEVRPVGLFELAHERFDLIVMHDVLEHIDQEGAALDTIVKMLNPGGHLILTVPALDYLYGRHDEQLGHFRRYSKTTLRRAVNGRLRIRRLRYFGFMSIPIVWILSKQLRREYPKSVANGQNIVSKLYSAACRFEEYAPLPLGTSVMLVALRD